MVRERYMMATFGVLGATLVIATIVSCGWIKTFRPIRVSINVGMNIDKYNYQIFCCEACTRVFNHPCLRAYVILVI